MLLTVFPLFFSISINIVSAAHAGFYVQYPWASRRPYPETRSGLEDFKTFCGMSPYAPTSMVAILFNIEKVISYATLSSTPLDRGVFSHSPVIPGTLSLLSILRKECQRGEMISCKLSFRMCLSGSPGSYV